jgi:deoxyribonuclease V
MTRRQTAVKRHVICIMPYADIIISFMEFFPAHDWKVDSCQARDLQSRLSRSVIRYGSKLAPHTIAGIDVSITRFSKIGRAAVVVLNWPSLEPIDLSMAEGKIDFPYIPGLLSFREAPLVLEAWKRLRVHPDLIMVDGQGIAHPRRLGIASHLGIILDVVSIGCAKSRLIGENKVLSECAGTHEPLFDHGEVIGAAVRTRRAVKPVYVSIGHKIDLESSISWVLKCCRGLRLPEPTRLAHLAAGGHLDHALNTARTG